MNINFKTLFLGTSLSLIPTLTQAQCVATTDCATLGYTQTSCPDGKGLKCPFGNTYSCPASDKSVCEKYGFKYTCSGEGYAGGVGQSCNKQYESCTCSGGYEWKDGKCEKEPGGTLGQCTGYAKNCKIGDILNSDGTCSSDKVNGKAPIGVVVYISQDGRCGQAMTAEPIVNTIWKPEEVQAPMNDKSESEALQDYDSCSNTSIITSSGTPEMFPAAWAAKTYAPVAAPETKGKWCLPAAGVLSSVYYKRSVINKSFSKAGGLAVVNAKEDLLSSTRFSFSAIWVYCSLDEFACAYDNGLNPMVMRVDGAVRPVIEF